ncbi:MAG TPA: tetratricopeptide repeat protein [Caulobacteraceae bacterium]|jgi:tetratricopeptide (TPR) repeat protein|nr:tetratricopeptide repeat protein [Caulobacteraceae bacterium]
MKLHPLLGAALALALAGPAAAAVTVMGDSNATLCSRAAFAELGTYDSLQLCTAALSGGMLDRHDLAGTYINRGVVYMVRLDYKSARADFDQAITIDPSIGEGWVNRGAIDIIDRRYKEGISDISKGLDLGTNEPAKAYYNRGVAYEGIDDEASAYQDYEEALVLQPGWDLPKQELLRFTVTRK